MSIQGKKILYLFDASDWQSRLPVAEEARAQGMDVAIALIGAPNADLPGKFKTVIIPTSSGRLTPAALLRMMKNIRALLRKTEPDYLHTVTLKYAFVAGLAALPFRKLHKIYTLAGLGYLFRSDDAKPIFLRKALGPVLKFVLKAPRTFLIFQNPDDQSLMSALGFTRPGHAVLIRGSGVNLQKFAGEHTEDSPPLVLMPTRLVYEKGIHIFIDAAKILANKGINASFQIAGGETKHNPRAISRAGMEKLVANSPVTWLGRADNMPALLGRAALIVYPSYYGEGIPRVLLESCAAGKAIITTDHPGCREAVAHGSNGLLVPVKDAQATADAIEELLFDPARRLAMGQANRIRAETEFDIIKIAQQTVQAYKNCQN